MNKLSLLLLPLALSGCAAGNNYKMPDTLLPESWFPSDATKPQTDEKAAIEQQWWHNFGDPVLDELIGKADAGNLDLQIYEARIAQARAARAASSSELLPSVNIIGGDTRQANRFTFGGTPFPGMTKPFNTFQAGFDASWEPDLFGGKKRALESSEAEVSAAEASRDDMRVRLSAEVASTYIDIRSYQQQLRITSETIAAQRRTVDIVRENYHAGRSAQLSLMQAQAQLEQTETQLPYYQNLLAQAEYSMDVLLGEQPGTTHKIAGDVKPIPAPGKALVLAAPALVIANRPDIRIAERKLASATAQQGVAAAKFFPDISLSGFVGLLNVDAGHLLEAGSKSWELGGNILSPILNYGRLSANLEAADARQQEALASYRKAIISALSDVAKTVTAYSKQEEYRKAVEKTVLDNRKTAEIARTRYKEGVSSFIEVLDAQRTLYASESQLVKSNTDVAQDLIAVYKSLGGGWKNN
jgi:NodT family efflux transporter outer membrane factor (OMF) lipoprotein